MGATCQSVNYYPRPGYCLRVEKWVKRRSMASEWFSQSDEKKAVRYSPGQLSPNAHRKIKQSISWLGGTSKVQRCWSIKKQKWVRYRLSFVTLTVPFQGEITDKRIKQALNNFITLAKYRWDMYTFVWVAETQKRGELHFHFLANIFIHKTQLQQVWNRIAKRYGLIGSHENPPSTRVNGILTHHSINNYMRKYFVKKEEEHRAVEGRLWGRSHNLARANKNYYKADPVEALGEDNDWNKASFKVITYDWCKVFVLRKNFWRNLEECELKSDYLRVVKSLNNFSNVFQEDIFTPT